MSGVKEPNYTQAPNEIFDLMPQMGDAELRVVMAICRQTFGWHRKKDKISLTQLQQLSGLSRQGVVNGLAGKIAQKIIRRKQDGDGYIYWLKVVNEVDQVVNGVDQWGSQRGRLELVNEVDRQLVNDVDIQKKELNKRKKDHDEARASVSDLSFLEGPNAVYAPQVAGLLLDFPKPEPVMVAKRLWGRRSSSAVISWVAEQLRSDGTWPRLVAAMCITSDQAQTPNIKYAQSVLDNLDTPRSKTNPLDAIPDFKIE